MIREIIVIKVETIAGEPVVTVTAESQSEDRRVDEKDLASRAAGAYKEMVSALGKGDSA